MRNAEYKELKPLKHFLFEFFKSINEFRTVGQSTTLIIIMVSFFQIYFLLDSIFVGGNLNRNSNQYKQYSKLSVYDFVGLLIKFTTLIPLYEYHEGIFQKLYPLQLVILYIFIFFLFIGIIFVSKCIIQESEIYFSLATDYISTFFHYFQWVIFLIIQLTLLYPFYGHINNYSPYNYLGFKITNGILSGIFFIFSFIISVLNNDALNVSDNHFCRKDCSMEIWLNILRIILLVTYMAHFSQAYNNAICILSSIIVIVLLIKQFKQNYFYSELVGVVFSSFLLCYLKILISGFIALLWEKHLFDYSVILIGCYVLSFLLFSFVYKRKKNIIIKKNLNDLKTIDELIYFTEILEDETMKSVIGDPISSLKIMTYINEHQNICKQPSCPLKNQGELFLPLINKSSQIKNNQIETLHQNEIFLIHLIKEVFMLAGNRFYGKPKFHFAYARFLLYRFGNIKLALIEIENSKKFSYNIQQQYSFYILKHIANERLLNNQYYIANYAKNNISIVDILDVIVFDDLSKELEKEIFNCACLKKEFWKIFQRRKVIIEDLYRKGNNYINKKASVDKIWTQINIITNQNIRIINLYNEYLTIICDNKTNQIIKEEKIKGDDSDEIDDLVETRFYDDICLFIINTSFGTEIGNIQYYNRNVSKIFDYKPDELIGKNISIIQPETIGKVHNEILVNFLETGKTRLIGNNTPTFIKLKNKLIRPINLLVMPIPSFGDKNEVLGLIRSSSSSNFYLLFNEFGIVDSISDNFNVFLDKVFINLEKIEMNCDVDFFVFYLFPFLLQPIEHPVNLPLFLHENSLIEYSQTQICGYFDPNLFGILGDIMENILNSKLNSNRRKNTSVKVEYEKLSENEKRKFLVYTDFCKSLIKLKELIKNEANFSDFMGHVNNSDVSDLNNTLIKRRQKQNGNTTLFPRGSIGFSSKKKIDVNNVKNYFTEQYHDYKNYMEEISEAKENKQKDGGCSSRDESEYYYKGNQYVKKKIFNCKLSLLHFNKKNKIYIMELSIPPNDVLDNNANGNNVDTSLLYESNNGSSLQITDDKNKISIEGNRKDKGKYDQQNTEDTGSISGNVKISVNSIQALIQKIRDDKFIGDTFHKSSYMNLIFFLYVLVLLILIIVLIVYVYYYTSQIESIFYGYIKYIELIDRFLILRKLTHIEQKRYELQDEEFPNIAVYNVNETLTANAAELLLINKNISQTLYKITDNTYVNQILTLIYKDNPNERFTTMIEVENTLIKNNLYVTDMKSLSNSTFVQTLKTTLNIDISNSSFEESTPEERLNKIKYIKEHTTSTLFDLLVQKKGILRLLFDNEQKKIEELFLYSYISLSILAFLCMLIVFIILRKMYYLNKKKIEKLTAIKSEDINEIINGVDEFLTGLKKSNSVIEDYVKQDKEKDVFANLHLNSKGINDSNDDILIEEGFEDELPLEDELAENDILIMEGVEDEIDKSKKTNLKKKNQRNKNYLPNLKEQNILKKKGRTVIIRKTKIFLSFTMNIVLIIIILALYFSIDFLLMIFLNSRTLTFFNFTENISESKLISSINLYNLRDIFISNNKTSFNSTMSQNNFISYAFELMKQTNLKLFTSLSKKENKFPKDTQKRLNYLFYDNLCKINETNLFNNLEFDCHYALYPSFDFSKVFPKGMKYAIDYFNNQIDYIKSQYSIFESQINQNITLYELFIIRNEFFIVANIIIDRYLINLYTYILSLLPDDFGKENGKLFIFVIAYSFLCLLILIITICAKWLKYSNTIRVEEFTSIKLIAEIPISIIMKNNEILNFLKKYAVGNK